MAGTFGDHGYREGEGSEALFKGLRDIVQTEDGFIVTDSENHCLRFMKFVDSQNGWKTGKTSTYAGKCQTSGIPYDKTSLLSAKFLLPTGMVKEKNFIYISDQIRIIMLDIVQEQIQIVHTSRKFYLQQLMLRNDGGFYVTTTHGILRIQNGMESWLVGSANRSFDNEDTRFSETGFWHPAGISSLVDGFIVVADRENDVIKIVNLELQEVYVFCTGRYVSLIIDFKI